MIQFGTAQCGTALFMVEKIQHMSAELEPILHSRPPSALGAWLRRNPVALKELRGRMRGARAFVVLTVYVTLMSLFAVLLYAIYSVQASVSMTNTGGAVGKLIFGGVAVSYTHLTLPTIYSV